MKTDSVTAKGRHVINSSPLVLSTNVESCMKQFLLKSATNCLATCCCVASVESRLKVRWKTQIDEINSQIEPIHVCIKADRLKANIEKTKYMIFS